MKHEMHRQNSGVEVTGFHHIKIRGYIYHRPMKWWQCHEEQTWLSGQCDRLTLSRSSFDFCCHPRVISGVMNDILWKLLQYSIRKTNFMHSYILCPWMGECKTLKASLSAFSRDVPDSIFGIRWKWILLDIRRNIQLELEPEWDSVIYISLY